MIQNLLGIVILLPTAPFLAKYVKHSYIVHIYSLGSTTLPRILVLGRNNFLCIKCMYFKALSFDYIHEGTNW